MLVVGVESLLTALARCCRPAPPDAIAGYVTRGKGVAVHRVGCSNLRELVARSPERVIPVAWGAADRGAAGPLSGRRQRRGERSQGLLRDVSEVFAKEKINVTGVQVAIGSRRRRRDRVHDLHGRGRRRGSSSPRRSAQVCRVSGVRSARRR